MAANISLKQLKVFTTLIRHKTLTSASESLYLSKAAVSMTISELEKQIGHALFDRINNRLILNQEGQRLLPLADELLQRSNEIETLFSQDEILTGQLRIGASDTIGNQLAPNLLSQFRTSSGHTSQSLVISNTSAICQKLVDYELDIGLVEGNIDHPEISPCAFGKDQMCIICPTDHPFTKTNILAMNELNDQNWVLREPGSGSREFFLTKVATQIKQWNESFQLNTTESLINSVSAGLGLGCLSQLSAQHAIQDGRVGVIKTPLDMSRQFWILLHKEKYQSSLLKRFIEFCNKY
ncbi:LysR family transcriptional regulator [Vibrio sp. S4M6]|uniref:LysR family transcriptional regulator n=1 Tax=Vibrio sinus TaxID=2946865 RepID=UPI00202A0CC0|nr:LysR family transcriptional regulator [Vibrio sinus]MCL9782227.1 LysR family transcriptional regulator [Vibrio sinus]